MKLSWQKARLSPINQDDNLSEVATGLLKSHRRAWKLRVCVCIFMLVFTYLLLVVIIVVIVQPFAGVEQHGARYDALADVMADLEISRQQRLENTKN